MNNKDIAKQFNLLAKLMELHEENPFKIRSYENAYLSLRKLEGDLSSMSHGEISAIPGVGDAITKKIEELLQTGKMQTLEKYKSMTPPGVQEMLSIRGVGPKKIKQLWKELGITSVGELLYACNENRLIEVKGFGQKSQEEIRKKVEFFVGAQGRFLYSVVEKPAMELIQTLQNMFPEELFSMSGMLRRQMPEVEGIEIQSTMQLENITEKPGTISLDADTNQWSYADLPILWTFVPKTRYYSELFKNSASEAFLMEYGDIPEDVLSEEEIFEKSGIQYITPEYRETAQAVIQARKHILPDLIEVKDIRGILHNHSTYSDGLYSLKDMADYVQSCGFEYFLISDHSRSATYAQGLSIERVLMQFEEIDELNKTYQDFKIYKGIESDILGDGDLDYPEEILRMFDVVIASVHSNLNMDIDKATQRLLKAVENKYTRILGHPTGRLLLAREGYPLDHKKIIDACAAHDVVIELNANPQRLDLDWTWVDYAMQKGVRIAINPDAHSIESIHYIKYGVIAARKGGLTPEMCLNTLSKPDFEDWVKHKK